VFLGYLFSQEHSILKIGDLIKFDYVNGHTRSINNKIALYLGERPIHRGDGKVVVNHAIAVVGNPWGGEHIIDAGLLRWANVVE